MRIQTSADPKILGKKVVVVGSMNCMPTEYAISLAKSGANVIHYYDAGPIDSLSNPLVRYSNIVDQENLDLRKLKFGHPLHYIASKFLHASVIRELRSADIAILSGQAISLARYLSGKCRIIALGYGDDISVFCNPVWPIINFKRRSLIAQIGFGWALYCLQSYFVYLQRRGLACCTSYSYFFPGFDVKTDALLSHLLTGDKPNRVNRYSISTDNLPKIIESPVKNIHARLKVIFPVRFTSEATLFANKGWRSFIHFANSYIQAKNYNLDSVAFICFNKGSMVAEAQQVTRDLSIDKFFHWFDVVPFYELYSMMNDSDVVVDQLGDHWVGVGMWAGLLGKPVICHLSNETKQDLFRDSYFLQTSNDDQFCEHLFRCETPEFVTEAKRVNPAVIKERFSIKREIELWFNQ